MASPLHVIILNLWFDIYLTAKRFFTFDRFARFARFDHFAHFEYFSQKVGLKPTFHVLCTKRLVGLDFYRNGHKSCNTVL